MKLTTKIIIAIIALVTIFTISGCEDSPDISSARYAQTGCYIGNVGVSTPDSYAIADAYDCIQGNLTVYGNYQITDLIFHNLRTVTGSIYIVGRRTPAAWQIAFLKLETVGGYIDIGSNPKLINVQLGAEIYDIGGLEFYNNDSVKTLRLGALKFVESDLRIYENNSLKKIIANDLENVRGEFEISDNPKYSQCDALAWQRVSADTYLIEGNLECEP
jgi:hypothetical protein